jgi:hypothetical protein
MPKTSFSARNPVPIDLWRSPYHKHYRSHTDSLASSAVRNRAVAGSGLYLLVRQGAADRPSLGVETSWEDLPVCLTRRICPGSQDTIRFPAASVRRLLVTTLTSGQASLARQLSGTTPDWCSAKHSLVVISAGGCRQGSSDRLRP